MNNELKRVLVAITLLVILPGVGHGQNDTDTISDYSSFQRKFTLHSLIVGRYVVSLTDDVDYSGQHFINPGANDQDVVSNSFELQYARLFARYDVNDRFSSTFLINLADFQNKDVSTKVLEFAFIEYNQNEYLNLVLGQFRPFFGLEDMFPFVLANTYKWSRQYNLFGANGWQSFQAGAALYGNLTQKEIPLYYYFTAYNGNNKNQLGDNDNSKNFTLRFEYEPIKNLRFGVNGALANYKGEMADAYGVDLQYNYLINKDWEIDINAEYKQGTNFLAFRDTALINPELSDYRMGGFYTTLQVRYKLNKPRIRSLDFCVRQEYLDNNMAESGNVLNEFVPMVSLVFAGDFASKLSLVGVISDYENNIPGTSNYDSNQILIQYQLAF